MKQRIQQDSILAMKNKNEVAKTALASLKTKISVAEKLKNNQDLTDSEVLAIITKEIKQRKESADAFEKGGRHDLAIRELAEIDVFNQYMPAQMTESEIEAEVRAIIVSFPEVSSNPQALVGRTIGAFNKKFQGRAETATVKSIIEKIVNS